MFVEALAFADQREREMREWREISAGTDAALGWHKGRDLAIQ